MNSGPTTAADVMNAAPRTCSRFSRVIEAVMIFKDEDCGMVPVVEEGRPIGVVTDRDVALALGSHPADLADLPVEEVMSTGPVTVATHAGLDDVKAIMGAAAVRRLLVVDDEGLLRGVIAWKDLAAEASDREVGGVVSEVVDAPASP